VLENNIQVKSLIFVADMLMRLEGTIYNYLEHLFSFLCIHVVHQAEMLREPTIMFDSDGVCMLGRDKPQRGITAVI
jgi:hypothetical protein